MRIRRITLSLVLVFVSVVLISLLLPWHAAADNPLADTFPPTGWQSGGPYMVEGTVITPTVVLDVVASPAYAGDHTLFTATRSGIFRTIDRGATWQLSLPLPVTGDHGYFSHVRLAATYDSSSSDSDDIAVAAFADSATDTATLYQSTDAGSTWQPLSNFTATVRALALSPLYATDQTLFALTGDGTELYKSTDGGQIWQTYPIGPEVIFNGFALAVSPAYATDQTLFATGYGTVHRSTDGGENWSALETYGITFGLALSPNYGSDQSLWATYRAVESPGDGTPENSVMRSFDRGDSWLPTASGLPGAYEPFARTVAVSPHYTTDQSLFTALSGQLLALPDHALFRSYDQGGSWVDLGAPPGNPDIFALAVTNTPTEGVVVHVATAQGLWHYRASRAQYVPNSGFEYDSGWHFPTTAYPATYSSARAHSGLRSAHAGISKPTDNRLAYSSVQQLVTIPRDALSVTLSFWWNAFSEEGDLPSAVALNIDTETLATASSDRQYLLLLDEENRIIERLLWTRRTMDVDAWEPLTFDLSAYAGKRIQLHFGVYNDGLAGVTALFVDDVTVTASNTMDVFHLPIIRHQVTPLPVATVSPTPGTTPTTVVTPTVAALWPVPPMAIELFSPLPNETYRTPIDVNGFGRTFEGNVYLKLVAMDGTLLAQHRARAGMTAFDFFHGYLRFEVSEELTATLAVYEAAAADQPPITLVEIPLRLQPGQRFIDLNRPAPGSINCGRVPVGGYSNTFEATVGVELTHRDGTLLEQTYTMGGNLGIYGEFATYFDYLVTMPQAALVGAYEVSPRDGALLDHSRVPVSLYPAGTGACP